MMLSLLQTTFKSRGQAFNRPWNRIMVMLGLAVLMAGCGMAHPPDQSPPVPEAAQQQPASPKAPETQQHLRTAFIAFGDMGAGTGWQNTLATHMAQLHDTSPYPVALLLGDLIYPSGEYQKLGQARFIKPYEPLRKRGVKLLCVLGNHDYLNKQNMQGLLHFFNMPGRYYTHTEGPVQFFALDTNNLDPAQLQWLETQLSQSKALWKVVFAHHPPYTSGPHGTSDGLVRMTRTKLVPLLNKYQVDLYLSGHDHDYERFEPINGVTYVVSGGGGAWLRDFKKVESHSVKRLKTHHYTWWQVQGPTMTLKTFNLDGQVIDTVTLRK